MNPAVRFGPVFLICAIGINGCSDRENRSPMPSISSEARAGLQRKVNCKTAQSDIQMLESEKASVERQMLAGARAVFPISAVAGILMGDYRDRAQVATGQYNRDLQAKIEEIQTTCGVR